MKKDKNMEKKPEEIKADESIKGRVNHPLSPDALKAIIHNKNTNILNIRVDSYDPINVAKAVEELDPEEMLFFFKTVKSDLSAEVFTHLSQESKEEVVSAFSSTELHNLVEPMAKDDLVDFVDDLPSNLITKVLKATSPEDKQLVTSYLNFKDDSAGTLRTPEYLELKDSDTIGHAIKKIREEGENKETIWELFVIDNTRRLVGTVTLDRLIEADENDKVEAIRNTDVISANVNTDQEVVLKAFRKYDVSVIPVVNNDQRRLGIITFDDAMDVASDEITEDIALSSAVLPSETPYRKLNIFKMVKNYAVWLIALLALDTFTSIVRANLQAPLAVFPLLITLLPSIMAANGNATDQTSAVTIREMALGNITEKNFGKALWKEARAARITGAILAVVAFGWTRLEVSTPLLTKSEESIAYIQTYYNGNTTLVYLLIALASALTYFLSITIAKVLACSLPMVAKKRHLDPAVRSQPVLSTIMDIRSIVCFFLFSLIILKGI